MIRLLGLFLLVPAFSFAQQFGGTPPSQHWKQINTDTARLIFPPGLDTQATRIATIIHYLAANRPMGDGNKLKKINIVLQHNTTIANAYVGLGPFRSEFYMTSATNNFDQGSIPWNDQLALHEYRHVQQFNYFNNGLSSVMKVLFGEDGYALAINAAVPDWFFEGDAVYNETWLTKQGRGRLPLFLNAYPALWKAGKNYSWAKLRNGSLKDYVPNHYNLGYLLVNYGREKYGVDFWDKVTKDASAFKGLFYPFQTAIKKYSGVDYKTFRENAFQYYKEKLSAVPDINTSTAAVADNRKMQEYVFPVTKNYVTNYFYPYQSNDSLIYQKSSFRQRPGFYVKTPHGTHRIRTRDISTDEQFSFRNGKIVYAAYTSDPRWGWRDYSDLRMVDVQTGKQTRITNKSKYFTPDISMDGSKIVAVNNSNTGKSELHILQSSDGSLIKAIKSEDITLFTDPKFIDDKNIVTAVRLRDGKMALALAEIETGNTMRLTSPSYNVIGQPWASDGNIYFTASYEGNDDIYMLRVADNKIFRITHGPLGNYFVNASSGKISWSSFTAEGYQLKQEDISRMPMEEMSNASVEPIKVKFGGGNGYNDILSTGINDRSFQITKYKKSTGLFHLHSWRPTYSDPVLTFSVFGQNILNTLQTELYYQYDRQEKTNAIGVNAVYGAWFPNLVLGTEYTFNRKGLYHNKIRNWDQLDTRIGFSIPLSFASGQTFKDFSFSTYYVVRNEFNKGYFKDSLGNTTFSYASHSISYIQQVQRAAQHIYPRFAFSLSGSYRYALTRYEGHQAYGSASLYVPGILSNHNLILGAAIQQRDTSLVLFSSRYVSARGYADYYLTNAGSRLTKLSADYHLPIWHPDFGFGNIVYIQRLRMDLFFDYEKIYSNNKKNSAQHKSVGVEGYADTKWWNEYPLTFGFRVSRLLDNDPLARRGKGSTIFEFVLPVNIVPR